MTKSVVEKTEGNKKTKEPVSIANQKYLKMKFLERKQKMEYLLEMIEKGRCISLSQIADKFEVSRRTVKRMIAELREEGHYIKYCKFQKKFRLNKE